MFFSCFQTEVRPCVFIQSLIAFREKLQCQQSWDDTEEIQVSGCVQTLTGSICFKQFCGADPFITISGLREIFLLTALTQILQHATLCNNLWHTSCNVLLSAVEGQRCSGLPVSCCLNVLLRGICHLVSSGRTTLITEVFSVCSPSPA